MKNEKNIYVIIGIFLMQKICKLIECMVILCKNRYYVQM